jgi:hypothetical protein
MAAASRTQAPPPAPAASTPPGRDGGRFLLRVTFAICLGLALGLSKGVRSHLRCNGHGGQPAANVDLERASSVLAAEVAQAEQQIQGALEPGQEQAVAAALRTAALTLGLQMSEVHFATTGRDGPVEQVDANWDLVGPADEIPPALDAVWNGQAGFATKIAEVRRLTLHREPGDPGVLRCHVEARFYRPYPVQESSLDSLLGTGHVAETHDTAKTSALALAARSQVLGAFLGRQAQLRQRSEANRRQVFSSFAPLVDRLATSPQGWSGTDFTGQEPVAL